MTFFTFIFFVSHFLYFISLLKPLQYSIRRALLPHVNPSLFILHCYHVSIALENCLVIACFVTNLRQLLESFYIFALLSYSHFHFIFIYRILPSLVSSQPLLEGFIHLTFAYSYSHFIWDSIVVFGRAHPHPPTREHQQGSLRVPMLSYFEVAWDSFYWLHCVVKLNQLVVG